MLKLLLGKQLREIFRSYFYNAKKNTARTRGATIAYIVLFVLLMVGLLGGMFALVSLALCSAMAQAGMDWLYFALMGLISILLGAFGSVFNTYSGLYLAKDNDLLLSMPIPVGTIIAARLLGVYLMGLMYSSVVIVPAIVVYWVTVSASLGAVVGGLVLLFGISVFVLTLSCALGWVVAKISLKLKNKSLITVLASLVFFGLYYFCYFKAQSLIGELVANAAFYGEKIRGAAYPLYLFGRVATGDASAMLLVTAVLLLLFGLVWLLLSRSFLQIATASGRTARKVYRETATKVRTTGAALLQKEFRRFLASPNYILNCGLGTLLLPLCGIGILWKGRSLLPVLTQVLGARGGGAVLLLCTLLCLLSSMNDMAAPSVSLEGKTLGLIQSLPVAPWQVLRAKLQLQILLTAIPAAIYWLCALPVIPASPLEVLLGIAASAIFMLFFALFALFLGLKMPNLTWTSEITPIKQSGSVAIALFGAWGYALLLFGLHYLVGYRLGLHAYLGAVSLLTLLLCAGLYRWLRKKGCAVLTAL